MPYTPTTYVNGQAPPLSAFNLNKTEIGVRDGTATADAAQATASAAQATAASASSAAAAAQTTANTKRTQAQVRDDAALMLTGGTHTNVTATRVGDFVNLSASGGGPGGSVNSVDILDSTAVGRDVLTAASAAIARSAIGAGTSNLVIGTTVTTAKAGNYQPSSANISDATATGISVLTAASPTVAREALGALPDAAISLNHLPPGAAITIDYYKAVYGAASAWPTTRPTARTDLDVTWRGPSDPGVIMLAGDMLELVAP